MRNFLNIHVLISHSPSCLNRDDMNMQKSAYFGGVRRVRISSQSLKRAIRKSDFYLKEFHTSDRTNHLNRLFEKYAEALKDKYSSDLVKQVIELLSGKEGLNADSKADSVAPWSVSEVAHLCELVKTSGESEPKKLEKLMKDHAVAFRQAMASTLDIALSGRMATSGLMSNVDGALSVAHAITTHEVNADIDWFTAVDDLVAEAGEVGAGHLATQEFGSGVFYRYASLDLRLLNKNLGGVSPERLMAIAHQIVHLFATVVPSAKQHTFAAHNLADLVYVTLGDIPISGANAFEEPVKRQGGYIKPSIQAFEKYVEKVRSGYGLDEESAVFSLWETNLKEKYQTLPELEDWLKKQAQG